MASSNCYLTWMTSAYPMTTLEMFGEYTKFLCHFQLLVLDFELYMPTQQAISRGVGAKEHTKWVEAYL